MRVKIIAKLETSDHSGYCSGNECEYELKIVETILDDIPTMYLSHPIGKIVDLDEYDWEKKLPIPNLNLDGSCYCKLEDKCVLSGLGVHDYKYIITSVELIK